MTSPLSQLVKKFFRFGCVSAIGTLAQFIVLTVLIELCSVTAVIASDTGMIIGAFINYFLGRSLAFRSTALHRQAMWKFFIVAAIGLLFNSIIMHFSIGHLHLPYLLAQIVATSLVVFWNFLANHYWTFKLTHKKITSP